MSFFLAFLKYSCLQYINSLYAVGVPTYEIYGSKKSIIDVYLTNTVSSVQKFEKLPNILGVNPQTSLRVHKLKLSDPAINNPTNTIPKVPKFRF